MPEIVLVTGRRSTFIADSVSITALRPLLTFDNVAFPIWQRNFFR